MYEPILYGWREGIELSQINRPAAANPEHPTTKLVELAERAIQNNSKNRDTILDPFAGSGTTVIACEKTGCLARVIELDPKYCDEIVRRWVAFTGRGAAEIVKTG